MMRPEVMPRRSDESQQAPNDHHRVKARALPIAAPEVEPEIELIERELVGVRDLWKQKLVPIARVTELERQAARLQGEAAQLIAQTAQVGGKIPEGRSPNVVA